MKSYLDSPEYQMMLAQILKGGPQSQYPGQAVANAGAQMVNALALKNYEGKQQAKEADYSKALASALAPQQVMNQEGQDMQLPGGSPQATGSMMQSPDSNQILAKLLGSGNADVTRDFAPMAVQSQMQAQALANQPMTPYQQANLGQQASNAQATRDAAATNLQATQTFTSGQNDLNRQSAMDIAKLRADSQLGSSGNVQSVQQIQLDDGRAGLLTVYRNGKREIVDMAGKPVISSQRDPSALFNQNAAKSGGTAAGTVAEAQPVTDANFQSIMNTLGEFEKPEVKSQAGRALGMSSYLPTIPGYNSDFRSRVGQLNGQAFLQAFNTLRGGGAITETEGAKATQAILRAQQANTEPEFYNALGEAKEIFTRAYQATSKRGARGAVVPQLQGGGPPQAAPAAPGGWKVERVQ